MKKIVTIVALLLALTNLFAQNYTQDDQVYDYIDQYKDLAMKEMELYKVPASITLAQAIYASKIGTNRIAKEANNHFGIMCHTKEWTGDTFYETDNHSSDYCFRKYASVEESYRDHSLFISQRSRYVKLFYFPITDYKSWANGLKEAGYSGNPRYADTLISLIEKYYLMHYDRKVAMKLGDTAALQEMNVPKPDRIVNVETPAQTQPAVQPKAEPKAEPKTEPVKPVEETKLPKTESPAKEESVAKEDKTVEAAKLQVEQTNDKQETIEKNVQVKPEKIAGVNYFVVDPYNVPFKSAYFPYSPRPVYENNKTKFIIAKSGDTYKKLASILQIPEKNLRSYNDIYDDSEPIEGEVVYVEMKATKSPIEYHTLQSGDTYRYVAQKYGVQLKIIIKRNSGSFNSYSVGDRICIGCK
ncbi:MAG: glucosaminidase domain-containing protein [Bacteroidales bacterium]|nr:glucosaminidase domain-containing protein [Bacteroidales bacterium]